jgi:hypothetical protein
MNEKLQIVTVATHKLGYLEQLIESCKRAGTELKILGLGDKWEGFFTKLKLMHDFLSSVEPSTIIVFIDAYDVIMLGNVDELLQRYLAFNKPIVLGVETKNSWFKWNVEKFYFGTYKEEIINTGGYMGRAGFLLEMCKNFGDHENDQIYLNRLARDHKNWFEKYTALDMDGDIFYNATCDSFLGHLHIKSCNIGLNFTNGMLCKEDGIQPIFLHGPGGIDISPYMNMLGWNVEPPDSYEYFLRTVRDYKYSIALGVLFLVFIIIMIVLLIKYFTKKKS